MRLTAGRRVRTQWFSRPWKRISKIVTTRRYGRGTYSGIVVEVRSEPLEASDEVNSIRTEATISRASTTWRPATLGLAAFESRRARAKAGLRSTAAA